MSCICFPQPLLGGFGRPFVTPSQAPRSDLRLPRDGRFRMGLLQTFSGVWARSKHGSMHKPATMATISSINNEVVLEVDDSCLVAHNLVQLRFLSMAVQSIIKLGIADILAGAEGRKSMSAEEILRQLPTKSTPGPNSVRNLQRLLSPLVREGLFSESLDGDEPVYGLTKVSQWFVRGNPLTIAPLADLVFSPVFAACKAGISEVILDETTTVFIEGHGVPIYEFDQPEFWLMFQTAMECNSDVFFKGGLENFMLSGVLDGVNTLVDVGGGRGGFVSQVVANNPRVQGINFDLPYVVAAAPAVNGVQHIGGSFFESVPSGDAIVIKCVLHNYSDEDVIQILKNCWKALPANGKVILADFVKYKDHNKTRALFVDCVDLIMLAYLTGARERSAEEYQALLVAAGFPRSHVTRMSIGISGVIQGFKE